MTNRNRDAYIIGARVKDLKEYTCFKCREKIGLSMDVERQKQDILMAGYIPYIVCEVCAGVKR